MLYSEIKTFLSGLNDSDLAKVKEAYKRCNESLVYIYENVDEPTELITAMLQVVDDTDELCEMIDSIDVFEQIEEEVRDYAESTELLHKAVVCSETDYSSGNWRIVDANYIDEILANEIADDPYTLGCFADWVIADATGWPLDLVKAAQKADLYQEIGEGMTSEHIEEVAKIYAQQDGYGNHFATYDSEEHEVYVTEGSKKKLKYYLFHI